MTLDKAVNRHKTEKINPKKINKFGNNKHSNINKIVSVPSINPAEYKNPLGMSLPKPSSL
tara:strand:+ start:309 stop:488 length:180 start_codon:yes stop_codon:yes gene_type:complete